MNTRRCELCGTLHGTRSGSVSIGVPRSDVDYCAHDHYNLCEACALKVYNMIEGLKKSDGKNPEEQSVMIDLIQRQNAEIARMRMCLRNANNDLYSATKFGDKTDNSQRMLQRIDSAIDWLRKSEPYEED